MNSSSARWKIYLFPPDGSGDVAPASSPSSSSSSAAADRREKRPRDSASADIKKYIGSISDYVPDASLWAGAGVISNSVTDDFKEVIRADRNKVIQQEVASMASLQMSMQTSTVDDEATSVSRDLCDIASVPFIQCLSSIVCANTLITGEEPGTTTSAVLRCHDAIFEQTLLIEAGQRASPIPSKSDLFITSPPCVMGGQCVAMNPLEFGQRSENHPFNGCVLMAMMTAEELDAHHNSGVVPDLCEARPCLLCYRRKMQFLVSNMQTRLDPENLRLFLSRNPAMTFFYNPTMSSGEPDVAQYRDEFTIAPSLTNGLTRPIVGDYPTAMFPVFLTAFGKWMICQTALRCGRSMTSAYHHDEFRKFSDEVMKSLDADDERAKLF